MPVWSRCMRKCIKLDGHYYYVRYRLSDTTDLLSLDTVDNYGEFHRYAILNNYFDTALRNGEIELLPE